MESFQALEGSGQFMRLGESVGPCNNTDLLSMRTLHMQYSTNVYQCS